MKYFATDWFFLNDLVECVCPPVHGDGVALLQGGVELAVEEAQRLLLGHALVQLELEEDGTGDISHLGFVTKQLRKGF